MPAIVVQHHGDFFRHMDPRWLPKRFEGGFVREPLPPIAASWLRARNPPLAGRVWPVRAPPASPGSRVSSTGRSLPHRVLAKSASISSSSPHRRPRPEARARGGTSGPCRRGLLRRRHRERGYGDAGWTGGHCWRPGWPLRRRARQPASRGRRGGPLVHPRSAVAYMRHCQKDPVQ